jgi:fumarate hydratase class II
MEVAVSKETRIEKDSLGEVSVPAGALYGAQTQRAVDNFRIGERPLPGPFTEALLLIKQAAAEVNVELGLLDAERGAAIAGAAATIIGGAHRDQFPVDVFQTGSGTSSNMNANEVLARLAGEGVHPNDHVNLCQSSNDVIPSALQLAACRQSQERLFPALEHLEAVLAERGATFVGVVKTGRTHLMDAMPLRLDQEFDAWRQQLCAAREDLVHGLGALQRLPLGGTAVGTGINAHPEFAERVMARLGEKTGQPLIATTGFRNLGSQDAAVAYSGRLNTLGTAVLKLCNDLRWMNSGPLSGLGEIQLPALQPGSSIMPGKVNPVIPEAAAMACVQVTGLHTAITLAGQSGNFQLNVMLPLIADNLLTCIALMSNAATALAELAIAGITVNRERLSERLSQNPVLVTALNRRIGYENGASIAKEALASGRSVLEVALERTDLSRSELETLLDPEALTHGGLGGLDDRS